MTYDQPIGFMLKRKKREWFAVTLFAKSPGRARSARKQWSATLDPNTIACGFEIEHIAITDSDAIAAMRKRYARIGKARIPLLKHVEIKDQVPA